MGVTDGERDLRQKHKNENERAKWLKAPFLRKDISRAISGRRAPRTRAHISPDVGHVDDQRKVVQSWPSM